MEGNAVANWKCPLPRLGTLSTPKKLHILKSRQKKLLILYVDFIASLPVKAKPVCVMEMGRLHGTIDFIHGLKQV